jgi:hypothetical protein
MRDAIITGIALATFLVLVGCVDTATETPRVAVVRLSVSRAAEA